MLANSTKHCVPKGKSKALTKNIRIKTTIIYVMIFSLNHSDLIVSDKFCAFEVIPEEGIQSTIWTVSKQYLRTF